VTDAERLFPPEPPIPFTQIQGKSADMLREVGFDWLATMRLGPGCGRYKFDAIRRGHGVYAVTFRGAGAIKIGFSSDFAGRFKQLATGSPLPLVALAFIAGDEPAEKSFHRKLEAYRQHREWFTDCREVRAFLVREAKRRGGVWNVSEGP